MFYFQCCGFTDDGSDVASGQWGHYHDEWKRKQLNDDGVGVKTRMAL